MRRVVVTGLGLVTPVGRDVDTTWSNLLKGVSGASQITDFSTDDLTCKIAAKVPSISERDYGFDPDVYMATKEQRKLDRFIILGMAATQQAIEDAQWSPKNEEEMLRTGVVAGSGVGGLPSIETAVADIDVKGPRRMSPFFIPSILINLLPGQISIKYHCKGINYSVVSACATGAHAIGEAARLIRYGAADTMIAGGAEAAICRVCVGGFAAGRALTTNYNDRPTEASRPWDQDRDGFVIGEGAGMVVLEEYEKAKARGAKIYGEIAGYGASGDAHHVTAPPESGEGGLRAMQSALAEASISPNDVDYINAHGTSTPVGDAAELNAIKNLFDTSGRKNRLQVSSTKSSIGHLLGAAGSVESVVTLLSMRDNVVHPTLNLHNPIDHGNIDLTPLKLKELDIKYAISNSFGFGGTNVSLVFKKI